MLPDHGDVFGVVDRELRAFAGGQCDEIDGGMERFAKSQQEQKRQDNAAEHDGFPSAGLFYRSLGLARTPPGPGIVE
jgi:hypothetical protein